MVGEEAVAFVAASLRTSTARARRLAHTALPAGFARSVAGAARVLLVEGATDAAVFGVLLEGSGVRVVAAGGKHALPLAAALCRAHGAAVHVVLDGDGGAWRRSRTPARARATARRATAQVLADLAPAPVTTLQDDLEAELAQWPSFTVPATKDPAAYEAAARAAARDDLPVVLRTVLAEVREHGGG
ncbi:TOPRIM nucleotidyl transferase/hydrolase domain-containing protein [Kineococcus sp. SYSU DK006]|uniref:TOPRIM nucleotidyl transferase/hydrolase domain-containing protein n=1 Tax=Kineococcus sp. SYSU DK006 TaxID=3383127 RepID=UPI003D7D076D